LEALSISGVPAVIHRLYVQVTPGRMPRLLRNRGTKLTTPG
jgi:hypothetical protein